MTKKRKAKIAKQKAIALLLAIAIGSAVIGHAGEKEAYKMPQDAPIVKKVVSVQVEVKQASAPVNLIKLITNKPEVETEVYEIASKLCAEKNHGDYCVKDLVAILNNETRFNFKVFEDGKCIPNGYSDNGLAMGCYQIYSPAHPEVERDQAENLEWSMRWALNYLTGKGYPKYRSFAIRSYNGSPSNPRTLAYLKTVNDFINN